VPKKKSYPYRLSHPKTDNPMKEMSWCHSRHIYVSCKIEGWKSGGQWEMGKMYCITVRQGEKYKETEYKFTKEDVVDAIYDAYRHLYNKNYGKTKE
jgi:hypothetical protein